MALAGELANTLVTRNSRATRTSKYLALQLRVTQKSARSRVQTLEYEFIARPLLVCYTLDYWLRVIESWVRVSNECDVAFERYCISNLARTDPWPNDKMHETTSSTDEYDREQSSLAMPSFTLWSVGVDRSRINLTIIRKEMASF